MLGQIPNLATYEHDVAWIASPFWEFGDAVYMMANYVKRKFAILTNVIDFLWRPIERTFPGFLHQFYLQHSSPANPGSSCPRYRRLALQIRIGNARSSLFVRGHCERCHHTVVIVQVLAIGENRCAVGPVLIGRLAELIQCYGKPDTHLAIGLACHIRPGTQIGEAGERAGGIAEAGGPGSRFIGDPANGGIESRYAPGALGLLSCREA